MKYYPAFLIAQVAKNFKNNLNKEIKGCDILRIAESYIVNTQKIIGGRIIFLESVENDKVLNFYATYGYTKLKERTTSNNTKNYI